MALEMDTATAFEHLYRENVKTVNVYTSARLGRDAGEDVTAEVFHAAVVAIRSGRSEQVTVSWLMTVARNKVIDRWRLAGRRKAKAHLLHMRDDLASFPPDWNDDHRRDAVLTALSKIKERHRILLTLHHVDGMPIVEIVNVMQQSNEAIESALVRARQAFRRLYSPPEVAR